jgi:hypothetical protein
MIAKGGYVSSSWGSGGEGDTGAAGKSANTSFNVATTP